MSKDLSHWKRFLEWFCQSDGTGISLDISRMGFDRSWWDSMQSSMATALVEMEKLESGAVANPDENRMVGHYWLRNPDIAPNDEIREKIRENLNSLHHFSDASADAYGQVSYLRLKSSQDEIMCKFVITKSRVAPRKRPTILRLELTA